jgi:hypothetical protein
MRIVIPQELSLPPIPPAAYRAKITAGKYKTSSNGNPMLCLDVVLMSQGPVAEIKTVGRKLVDQIVIQEDTLWRLNLPFKACTGSDLPAGKEFSVEELCNFVTSNVVNKEVVVSTDNETYQGSLRSKIKAYNPLI